MEQVHLFGDAAVIALGGLFHAHEMCIELLLAEPARAVDAAQHRVLLIAAPIGPAHARQPEGGRVQLAGGRQMRSPAQVRKAAAAIDGDVCTLRKFAHPLRLIGLACGREHRSRLGTVPHFAHDGFAARDDRAHLRFDRGQVLLGERPRCGRKIIVEAVFGRGAEGDLRAGEQVLHGFGQHMGIIVAHQLERVRLVLRGYQRELRAVVQRAGKIAHLAVHARSKRGLGQTGADRGGDIGGAAALGHNARRSVGKRYADRTGIGLGGGGNRVHHQRAPMARPAHTQAHTRLAKPDCAAHC